LKPSKLRLDEVSLCQKSILPQILGGLGQVGGFAEVAPVGVIVAEG
jgi:hypothetical protein